MKIKELIKDLQRYNEDAEVLYYLVPNTPEAEEIDENDEPLIYIGEIGTSQLDTDEPCVDIGLKLIK